jgi:hypothetical protein
LTFEVFDKRRASSAPSPFVSIQRRGPLSLNRAAHEAMGEPKAAELLFDRENSKIGIKPVDPTSPRGFPVRPQGRNGSTFIIAGQSFTKFYGIDTRVARRYAAVKEDDMLVIDLTADSVDVTGPRAKKRVSD